LETSDLRVVVFDSTSLRVTAEVMIVMVIVMMMIVSDSDSDGNSDGTTA
jgi:hypothetical protein